MDFEHPYATVNLLLSFSRDSGNLELAFFVNNITRRYRRVFDLDLFQCFGTAQSTFAAALLRRHRELPLRRLIRP